LLTNACSLSLPVQCACAQKLKIAQMLIMSGVALHKSRRRSSFQSFCCISS